MEATPSNRTQHPVIRQLASLKILSRLIGHELHSQSATKSVTLSRDEVIEIQTTVDLYIEELTRRMSQAGATANTVAAMDSSAVGVRN
ncbi:MAG: hypothetical protein IPJ19_11985 [Planctomycetes bacterium]|nr:hypothetical protein [Planctomycetota bacterium]